MKRVIAIVFLTLSSIVVATAQCAMCRSTLENNVSNGNAGIAAGINTGILYLLSMPYLAVIVLGYLWYRNSRLNTAHEFNDSTAPR